jgi:tRNA G18 (ribose-2'-O)-methylase SpoU
MSEREQPAIICQGDREAPILGELMPVTIVLDRLRSAFNVGNIFRLAEATRAEKIITCGYTATPPHPKLAKTARGCDALVCCQHIATATAAVADLQAQGRVVYAVETVASADLIWDVQVQFPAAFVLGNEALGIEPEAVKACHHHIRLPGYGQKNSINVGNCAAVVLYHALQQWLSSRAKVIV